MGIPFIFILYLQTIAKIDRLFFLFRIFLKMEKKEWKVILSFFIFFLLCCSVFAGRTNGKDKQQSQHLPRKMPIVSTCDVESTRQARSRLEEHFWPIISSYSYSLPPKCPFHQNEDALAFLDQSKRRKGPHKWICKICDKKFTSSEFLDNHIQNSHADLFPEESNSCYGDFCEILHCPSHQLPTHSRCDSQKMKSLRLQCEAIMHTCFPAGSSQLSHQLNDYFVDLFCDPLRCDGPTEFTGVFKQEEGSSSSFKMMAIVGLFLLLIVFYIALYIHYSDTQRTPYMQRLPRKKKWFWSR